MNLLRKYCSLFLFQIILAFPGAGQAGAWIIKDPALLEQFLRPMGMDMTTDKWLNGNLNVLVLNKDYTPSTDEYYAVYQALLKRYFFLVKTPQDQATAVAALNNLVATDRFNCCREYIFCSPVSLAASKPLLYNNAVRTIGRINDPDAMKALRQDIGKLNALAAALPAAPSESNFQEFENNLKTLESEMVKSGAMGIDHEKYQHIKQQYAENAKQWKGEWNEKMKQGGDGFEKGDNKDGSSTGSGKKKGWFPVDVSFSQWLGTLIEFIGNYLLPEIFDHLMEIAQQVATLAYMLAPDLVNNIVSTLAKLQHAVTPDNIDAVLNHIAEVADYALLIYKNIKSFQSMIESTDFKSMLKSFDIQKIPEFAQKIAPNKYLENFNKYFPDKLTFNNIKGITAETFQKNLLNAVKNTAKDQAKRYAQLVIKKIPVLNKISIAATYDLLDGKISGNQYFKEQGRQLICGTARSFRTACDSLVTGRFSGAAIAAATAGISKYSKIGKQAVEGFIRAGINKNYPEMWHIAADESAANLARKTGISLEGIKQMGDALEQKDYRNFIKGAASAVRSKQLVEQAWQTQLDRLAQIDLNDVSVKEAEELTNGFLQATMGDHRIANTVLTESFDYMLELSRHTDSLNGFSFSGKLRKMGFDKNAVQNFLKGNYAEEINEGLDSLLKGMGLSLPEARKKLKEEGFIAAFDVQRVDGVRKQSGYNLPVGQKIDQLGWESGQQKEMLKQLAIKQGFGFFRMISLKQLSLVSTK